MSRQQRQQRMCAACGSEPATDGALCSGCAAKADAAARNRGGNPDPS